MHRQRKRWPAMHSVDGYASSRRGRGSGDTAVVVAMAMAVTTMVSSQRPPPEKRPSPALAIPSPLPPPPPFHPGPQPAGLMPCWRNASLASLPYCTVTLPASARAAGLVARLTLAETFGSWLGQRMARCHGSGWRRTSITPRGCTGCGRRARTSHPPTPRCETPSRPPPPPHPRTRARDRKRALSPHTHTHTPPPPPPPTPVRTLPLLNTCISLGGLTRARVARLGVELQCNLIMRLPSC